MSPDEIVQVLALENLLADLILQLTGSESSVLWAREAENFCQDSRISTDPSGFICTWLSSMNLGKIW